MAQVLTLADFRPSARHDDVAWNRARIESAEVVEPPAEEEDPEAWEAEWTPLETVDLDPVDEDPTKPQLRSFTVDVDELEWYRIVFVDADDREDAPTAIVSGSGPQYRPTTFEVAAILRARLFADGEEPTGGPQIGAFTDETDPPRDEVESRVIPGACRDVELELGTVPGELLADARRVATLCAAKELERSYLPQQAEEGVSIYQTLRITFEEELKCLARSLEMWLHVNRGLL